MKLPKKSIGFLLLVLSLSFSAQAAISLNGFGSAYTYYNNTSEPSVSIDKGNWHRFSKIGINFAGQLTENSSAHLQAIASGDDSGDANSIWKLHADYAFLKIQLHPNCKLQLGRQVFPIWLSSGYRDVGIELPFAKQPNLTSEISSFKSFNGASVAASMNGSLGKSTLRFYTGEEKSNALEVVSTTTDYSNPQLQFKNILGTNFSFENESWNFNASFYTLEIDLQTQGNNPPPGYRDAPLAALEVSKTDMISIGLSYTSDRFLFVAEHGFFNFKSQLFGKIKKAGSYILLGLPLGNFMPRYTAGWSEVKHESEDAVGGLVQNLGLNYRFNENILFKAEYERGVQPLISNSATGGEYAPSRAKYTTILVGADFGF